MLCGYAIIHDWLTNGVLLFIIFNVIKLTVTKNTNFIRTAEKYMCGNKVSRAELASNHILF